MPGTDGAESSPLRALSCSLRDRRGQRRPGLFSPSSIFCIQVKTGSTKSFYADTITDNGQPCLEAVPKLRTMDMFPGRID
jgi:hypothetical protein